MLFTIFRTEAQLNEVETAIYYSNVEKLQELLQKASFTQEEARRYLHMAQEIVQLRRENIQVNELDRSLPSLKIPVGRVLIFITFSFAMSKLAYYCNNGGSYSLDTRALLGYAIALTSGIILVKKGRQELIDYHIALYKKYQNALKIQQLILQYCNEEDNLFG